MKQLKYLVMIPILASLVPIVYGNSEGLGSHVYIPEIKGVAHTETAQSSPELLNTIKNAINWALGMLSLVALAILLWGGFQIIMASGDDGKQKKGMTILKQTAIGLIIIGLSWLFVSLIFWLIKTLVP